MPLSKHRKKGKTSQQWRKDRNIIRAQNQAAKKTQKLGMMRAMRVMQNQINPL